MKSILRDLIILIVCVVLGVALALWALNTSYEYESDKSVHNVQHKNR